MSLAQVIVPKSVILCVMILSPSTVFFVPHSNHEYAVQLHSSLQATSHDSFPVTPTKLTTMEPRCNEPLYKEVLGISNHFLFPSNSKVYEKEPHYIETLLLPIN